METLDHKCPSCTANIPFNPKTQKWDCEYCGNSYTLEELNEFENSYKRHKKNNEDKEKIDQVQTKQIDENFIEYTCSNCGAKIILDKNTSATSCIYCLSTAIVKDRINGEFKPEQIIPFKNVKEDAKKKFYEYSKKKWFAPKAFCDMNNIEKLQGIYIPFWVYDCNSDGHIDATAKKITHWSTYDYYYTKTDIYKVTRDGNMTFEKIPVDGSLKFKDSIMDSIEPYEYNDLREFSPSYLSGFLAERYDVSEEDSYSRAKTRAENTTVDTLRDTIVGYDSVSILNKNVKIDKKGYHYMLLPVWLLNIRYKDKIYEFAMNGQTSKMVGNVPVSVPKLLIKSFILLLVSTIVLTLITLIIKEVIA